MGVILRLWLLAGLVFPLIIIFYYSLSTEEISIDKVIIKRWISRDRTEEKGELINVRLDILNNGPRIPVFEIVDKVPEECTIHEGSNHWLFEIKQNETISLNYGIKCHKRGRYILGPVITRGFDILHFHKKIKEHEVYTSFAVVPSLIKLRELPIDRQRLLPEVGYIPSITYKGRDFDFQGVRDYKEGDELRAINWRVTAKYNKLSTNEYALDQAARIFIIFDHTISTQRVLEEGVMAALSTVEYLISQRNKVGFFTIGEFVEEIPPASGKRQLLRINEVLIDVKPSFPAHEGVLTLRLQRRLLSSLPPISQIFFISPLYNRIILNFLNELAEKGHEIILIMPRLESIYEESRVVPNASFLANGLLALDRNYVTNQLSKLGITQIFWYPYGPKYETIKVRRTK